jgi:hypothetical protein
MWYDKRQYGRYSHLVLKLENFFKFSSGPLVDRVFKIGSTLSAALGEGNEAEGLNLSERRTLVKCEGEYRTGSQGLELEAQVLCVCSVLRPC